MKHVYRVVIGIALASFQSLSARSSCCSNSSQSISSCLDTGGPRSIYLMRSSGANSARELIGWQDRINNYDQDHEEVLWGSCTFAVECQKTFDSSAIAKELFGSNRLIFKGSQVASRTSRDIIADNFGLPTTYEGVVSFSPRIKTWTGEFQIYFGLDRWVDGLYARFNVPLVWTNWNIGACTKDITSDNALFAPGYMGIAPLAPLTSPVAAVTNLRDALIGNIGFGDKQDARHFGNIDFYGKTVVRVADIDMILGWNFFACPSYHLGFNAYFVLPFGNTPCPQTVFSPVVGNGRHYELGAGISGHLNLWEGGKGQLLALYLEGNCTHLFKNIQARTFDFCENGPLSRYLLLKQIGQPKLGATPADVNAYGQNLINGTDWSTRYSSVAIPCKGDVTLKLALRASWFGLDVGYNLYGQTRERVKILTNYPTIYTSNRFGIKGLLGTNYFVRDATADSLTVAGTLNSTASHATLFKTNFNDAQTTDNPVFIQGPGTYGYQANTPPTPLTSMVPVTLGVDHYGVNWHNPNSSVVQTAQEAQQNNSAAYYSGAGFPNQTNPGPDILELEDLSTYSGSGRGFITNKFFGFVSWNGAGCWEPFLGFGGEVEFEWGDHQGAHNQWGVIVKGGMAY